MQTKIQKWGNSLAVRIPKPYVKEAHLAYGTIVAISVADGKVVIDPHTEPVYSLEELLGGITKRNSHTEVDTGAAVGREVW
jgi:antitoxin MazE